MILREVILSREEKYKAVVTLLKSVSGKSVDREGLKASVELDCNFVGEFLTEFWYFYLAFPGDE